MEDEKNVFPDRKGTAISQDVFKSSKIDEPLLYREGDPITRDNFISWFVRGFTLSRGDPTIQYAYARWSAARTGLDFQTTMQNFTDAGAEECLSNKEKAFVINTYNRIKKHAEEEKRVKELDDEATLVDPVASVGYYASDFINPEEDSSEILQDFRNFNELEALSPTEFMQWAKTRREKKEAEKIQFQKDRS